MKIEIHQVETREGAKYCAFVVTSFLGMKTYRSIVLCEGETDVFWAIEDAHLMCLQPTYVESAFAAIDLAERFCVYHAKQMFLDYLDRDIKTRIKL